MEKRYRFTKDNKSEEKTEFEVRQFLSSFATPSYLNMFSNLKMLEGMYHYETKCEIIRIK